MNTRTKPAVNQAASKKVAAKKVAAKKVATRTAPAKKVAATRPAVPALQLSLQFADGRHRTLLTRTRVRRWLTAALRGHAEDAGVAAGDDAEFTVRVVDAEEGQALNRDYRGKDYATNVLTFDYSRAPLMADLVLCAPVVEAEAQAQGKSIEDHYAHLLVHGALHAQGHDHEDDDQAQRMEALERRVLAGLGIADPYA